MNKKLQDYLKQIESKFNELSDYEGLEGMSVEEQLAVAVDLVLNSTEIEETNEVNNLIGVVDLTQVRFKIDEGFEVLISGELDEQYEED